jgi:uncharacterized membrane protein YbhN (UPF0104 family)
MPEIDSLLQFSTAFHGAAILCTVLFHFAMEPLRWVVYLGRDPHATFCPLVYIFSSTAFFSYVLPAKLGIPLRFWLITKSLRLGASAVGCLMAADSALAMAAWAFASIVMGGEFAFRVGSDHIRSLWQGAFPWWVFSAMLMGLIAMIAWRQKASRIVTGLRASLNSLGMGRVVCVAGLFALDIAGYVMRHAIILNMLSAPDLEWSTIGAVTVVSIFMGFVSMMPMGLVGYDATIILLLTQSGLDVGTAAMVPVINRAANLLVSGIAGIPSAFKLKLGLNVKDLRRRATEAADER